MTSQEIHQIIINKGRGSWNFLKFTLPTEYKKIANCPGRTFPEKAYNYTHLSEPEKCIVCSEPARFTTYENGYTQYCCKKCYETVHGEKIRTAQQRGAYKNVGQKAKETFLKNGGSYEEVVKKQQQTMMSRYGVKNAGQMEDRIEKVKKSNIKKYGTEKNPLLTDSMIHRHKSGDVGFNSKKFKLFLSENNVINSSQLPHVKKIKSMKNLDIVVKRLLSLGSRLEGIVEPMFTRDNYFGSREGKYLFKCCKCNSEFNDTLINGKIPRCTKCYPLYAEKSFAQKEIFLYLQSLGLECLYNDRKTLGGLELDIYIPAQKIAIEYHGLYWHSELNGKDKHYHINKLTKCESLGIRLIQIFDDEWIHLQSIIKSRLKYICTIHTSNISARKCEIKEISAKEKNNFLYKHHIQGEDKSKIKIGAFYENKLIAVMTFGGLRRALGAIAKQDEFELMRFCTSNKSQGISSRLLSFFIKNYHPKKIISYADRRWSNGNLYEVLGFKKISDGTPNYWYLDKKMNRIHRYTYRKNVLQKKLPIFNPALTEWQNMQLNGFDRIWDCGSLKYSMVF